MPTNLTVLDYFCTKYISLHCKYIVTNGFSLFLRHDNVRFYFECKKILISALETLISLLPGCGKHSLVLGHTQRNSVITWLWQTFSRTGPYTEEWCYYLVVANILSYWAIHRGIVLLPGCAKHSLVLGHTQRNGVITWLCQTFSRTGPYTEE